MFTGQMLLNTFGGFLDMLLSGAWASSLVQLNGFVFSIIVNFATLMPPSYKSP